MDRAVGEAYGEFSVNAHTRYGTDFIEQWRRNPVQHQHLHESLWDNKGRLPGSAPRPSRS